MVALLGGGSVGEVVGALTAW